MCEIFLHLSFKGNLGPSDQLKESKQSHRHESQ
jgi:hypothetical protein